MGIPVIMLSGFLGSGKTTLLLSLLKESKRRGLQPGVLMNELGQQDVDGYILEEQTGAPVERLLDGCICCSRRDELEGCLKQLVQRRPDVIFLELTGVADPEEILAELRKPALAGSVTVRSAVALADAGHVLEYASRLSSDKHLVRTLRSQLAHADLILVNKCDLAERERLAKIDRMIRKLGRRAEIEYTEFSRTEPGRLLDGIAPREAQPRVRRAPRDFREGVLRAGPDSGGGRQAGPSGAVKDPSHSRVGAVTLSYPKGKMLPKTKVEAFFAEWADGLLRAKGHVPLPGEQPVQLVQYAGSRTTWEDSRYPGSPYLVVIGLDIDRDRLVRHWSSLFG